MTFPQILRLQDMFQSLVRSLPGLNSWYIISISDVDQFENVSMYHLRAHSHAFEQDLQFPETA